MTASETTALTRPASGGRAVIICDHATNFIPDRYADLGLDAERLGEHIAWVPGAIEVAGYMSERLDAPVVAAGLSRLVIDMNRPEGAAGSIVAVSDGVKIPGNANLSDADRRRRFDDYHIPYHREIEALLDQRGAATTAIIALHSFTPIHSGKTRPWDIGVLHNGDTVLAGPLLKGLSAIPGLVVGENEPYSPADDVYYTLQRHAVSRGLAHVMIEIRNDRIATPEGQRDWGNLLADILIPVL
ncbi:MAG: N-formylglutamate amidohydrolase [Rhodospirillales bacterium]